MIQQPLQFLLPGAEWVAPNLDDLPQDWNGTKRIGYDTETKDLDLRKMGIGVRRSGHTVGYSVALEDGPAFYLPIRHAGGGNLDPIKAKAYLRQCANNYKGIVVGANLAYDLDYSWEDDIHFHDDVKYKDVLLNDALIDELQETYNLEDVAQRRIGAGKEEDTLWEAAKAYGAKTKDDVKSMIWSLPAKFVGTYAEYDTIRPLQVARAQDRIIEEQGLQRVEDLESRLLPCLVRMRRRGVRIHTGRLDEIERWSFVEEAKALAEVKRLTGVSIGVGETMNADLCAKALSMVGVRVGMTSKGQPNIDKFMLMNGGGEVGMLIRRARKMSKLRTTDVAGVRRYLTPAGRLHCTFNQLRGEQDESRGLEGTITGRLSCAHLNLQQQQGQDPEIGPMWRSIYLPEEGMEWASLDFSSQEPRMLVHWAVCAGAKRIGHHAHTIALEFAKQYADDNDTDFHHMTAGFTFGENMDALKAADPPRYKKFRGQAKIVGLARIYGRGGASMCEQLGLPTVKKVMNWGGREREIDAAGPEGQAIIDKFDAKVPFAPRMLAADKEQAERYGFIRTIYERRCRYPQDANGKADRPYKALNGRIQGSSADQTKEAIIQLDRAGALLHAQVHDEADPSVENRKQAEYYAEIMENCVPMKVKSKVDVEVGESWGQAA